MKPRRTVVFQDACRRTGGWSAARVMAGTALGALVVLLPLAVGRLRVRRFRMRLLRSTEAPGCRDRSVSNNRAGEGTMGGSAARVGDFRWFEVVYKLRSADQGEGREGCHFRWCLSLKFRKLRIAFEVVRQRPYA